MEFFTINAFSHGIYDVKADEVEIGDCSEIQNI